MCELDSSGSGKSIMMGFRKERVGSIKVGERAD